MGMPKYITLINKQKGHEKRLTFLHALNLLLLEKKQGRDTYNIKGKYLFNGTDIVRDRSGQDSTESRE